MWTRYPHRAGWLLNVTNINWRLGMIYHSCLTTLRAPILRHDGDNFPVHKTSHNKFIEPLKSGFKSFISFYKYHWCQLVWCIQLFAILRSAREHLGKQALITHSNTICMGKEIKTAPGRTFDQTSRTDSPPRQRTLPHSATNMNMTDDPEGHLTRHWGTNKSQTSAPRRIGHAAANRNLESNWNENKHITIHQQLKESK